MMPVAVGTARTAAERGACFAIRRRVFVAEQGVPLADEFDTHDDSATHLLARAAADDRPLGTLRWRRIGPDTAKIERVAVLPEHRADGVGRTLMLACLEQIRAQGYGEAVLHAQMQAQRFYSKLFFVTMGDSFMEDGIRHVPMRLHPIRLSEPPDGDAADH